MFDFGWQEIALTGVVALIVLGPKELPGLMRTAGKIVRKARLIAHEFHLSFDEIAEEVEIDEVRRKAQAHATQIEPLRSPTEKNHGNLEPISNVQKADPHAAFESLPEKESEK